MEWIKTSGTENIGGLQKKLRNVFRIDLNESREGFYEHLTSASSRDECCSLLCWTRSSPGNYNAVLCFAGRALVLATITLFSALLDAL